MRLGIDIDGCLADFNTAFGEALIAETGEDKLPENWREQIASGTYPDTWNWHLAAGYTPQQATKVWQERVEGTRDFWYNLDIMPGAAQVIRQLNRLSKAGHEVYFLTHRSGKKVKQQTEEWLAYHGKENPTVILTGDKLPLVRSLALDLFVDDKLQTVNEVHTVFREFYPEHDGIFLKDAPWNREGRAMGLKVVESVEDALKRKGLWTEIKRGRIKVAQ